MKHKTKLSKRPDRPRCGRCQSHSFDHIGWGADGKPYFKCAACGHEWTCGADGIDHQRGHDYYTSSITHPSELLVVGWNQADYDRASLMRVGRRILFAAKKELAPA